MKKFLATMVILSSLIYAQTITIAAAAHLKYALDNLTKEFSKETGIKTKITTGASGRLTQQIMSGAPFDAFLSADVEYPQKLVNGGYTTTPVGVYAYGTLVLWSNTGIDLNKGIAILSDPSVKKIAIANPKIAPFGIEAMNSLKYYKMDNKVTGKIIAAESTSQVGNYVTTKVVDAGFMPKSLVMGSELKGIGKWIEVPAKSYNKIDQGMVGLKNGSPENQIAAKKFLKFMSSSKAREILKANGYILPN